ncbi:MAG: methylated-DNA--[protein]-cysteine S-methyltransferase [Pseudomonadota bacterium]
MNYSAIINSPVGYIGILAQNESVLNVHYLLSSARVKQPKDIFTKEIVRQCDAYFSEAQWKFNIRSQFYGTPYQRRVWKVLARIRYGETKTYGEIAREIASGARAVGNACKANPVHLIVPCHRVVGVKSFGGFLGDHSGARVLIKQWLLQHEKGKKQEPIKKKFLV